MHRSFLAIGLFLLAAGCATAPTPGNPVKPPAASNIPPDALVTQRGLLTIHGRQFSLTGYVACSESEGLRLILTENFGGVLADVLIKPDGNVFVMRWKPPFRPAWIQKYVAADAQCVFGKNAQPPCPVRLSGPNHFIIERRAYRLDLQTVEIKPGAQKASLFDPATKSAP